jgi:valyl-tRNA synthetase
MDGKPKTDEFPTMRSLVKAGKGESLEKIQERADICLKKIEELPEGTYIICGHGAFNSCLEARMQNLEGNDIFDFWNNLGVPKNASYRTIYFLTDPKDKNLEQDPDTLDTWFSSGLWTFSTLGWPNKEEFARMRDYHPTTVLETGYDILFFWVARMILMSTYFLGEVPFKTVYLHGLVRDAQGRKMSKSLGNIIDPVVMAEKYGADAVRMSLIIGTGPGNDSKMSEDKIRAYKNFANKMWNATRFVLSSIPAEGAPQVQAGERAGTITEARDEEILKKLDATVAEVNTDMDNYRFYLAGEKLYHYFWHEFADIIIEESKAILAGPHAGAKASRQATLYTVLTTCLKLLHPFMPFVTEAIWQLLPHNANSTPRFIMTEQWPR